MKILVIVNNHNSIGIVDFCINLKTVEKEIDVMAVCDSNMEAANAKYFNERGIEREVVQLSKNGGNEKKRFSVVNGAKELEQKTQNCNDKEKSINPFKFIALKLVNLAFSSSLFNFAREKSICFKLKKQKINALKLLKETKPDIVLSLSDRSHDYIESSVLWAARKYGIKVLLPYVAQYDIDAALKYRVKSDGKPLPELRPFWPFSIYKTVSYLQLRDQVYKGFFFQAPYILNANKKNGTLSAYPWWVGNGISDIVCVDSEYTAKKYISHKVKGDKIVVVGHISYDKVYRSYSNREDVKSSLFEKYSLEKEKKLIVLSMPQYAEQGYISWEEHWDEINSMMKEVSLSDNNLLVSIHPRSDVNEYLFIQKKYKCRIIDEPLSDVIGTADLFLASNSTTFVWAVLCGVPSIALMSPVPFLYKHFESIRPTGSNDELSTLINDVLNSLKTSFEKDWELLNKKEVFDGRFNERFLQLIHTASANKSVRP